LVDKDQFQDAMDGLEALLKKHQPTYEALLLQAKLLHHFQRFDETIAALLHMIRLSRTTEQQLAVMELLAGLGAHQQGVLDSPVPGKRPIRITHELVLFQTGDSDRSVPKAIPPGEYLVEETLLGRQRWLVLEGESWGNAEACWEAVRDTDRPTNTGAKRGLLHKIVRLQESVAFAIKGKPWRRRKEDARLLHKEANQLIRQGDWGAALPFLQKAAAEDPDNYEIAYRLVQAARQAGPPANPAAILSQVLRQSRWTEDQKRMLQQLNL
jgi:tetratricopeptide (TPR) repeat protein